MQMQTKEGGNADDEGGIGNADSLKLGKADECPVLEASDNQLEATEWREKRQIFEFKVRVVVNMRRGRVHVVGIIIIIVAHTNTRRRVRPRP